MNPTPGRPMALDLAALVLALALPALPAAPAPGDAIPSAIEELLRQPPSPIFFGIPPLLEAVPRGLAKDVGWVRCLVDAGDVTADGAPDVAAGSQPGSTPRPVTLRDGRSGAAVWARPYPGDAAGGFRSLRGLAARDGRLALAGSSRDGAVAVLDGSDGRVLWRTALVPSGAAASAQLYAVDWLDDLDGDGAPDLVAAGGERIDGVALLSGATGAVLAVHAAGDAVYDVRPVHDLDGDGHAELVAVGGDATPFARLLRGHDLHVLWDAPLDGPGSAVLALDDIDGDGVADVAVGQFHAPDACLLALDGAAGTRVWESTAIDRDVTSLALMDDMLDTGLRDIAVGSFDNATSAVLALNGLRNWRREATTNNGGQHLAVAVTSDLDGNGQRDVLAASVDQSPYVMGGDTGQFMAGFNARRKLSSVLALGDGDGDGRPEIVVGGDGVLWILDGNAGLADGPHVEFVEPASPLDDIGILVWAYPATPLLLFVGVNLVDPLPLSGFGGGFVLDPTALATLFQGFGPGAGISQVVLPPFPAGWAGITLFVQAVTLYAPGHGWISGVTSFTIPG